jgi:hypothetical protein
VTAIPRRRTKRTFVGLGLAVLLLAAAGVFVGVAVGTLRNSQAGQAVGIEERPISFLPSTPNALLTVEGDEGELTSIVVLTLLPSGRGGTVVTMPVNADLDAGAGEEPTPLDAAYEQLEFDDFVGRVESMLTIAIEQAESVDADRLADLVAPVVPIDVVLPEDVVDSSTLGTGIVAVEGEQDLRGLLVVDALTATDTAGSAYDHHDVDVAVWSGLAANAPVPVSAEMPRDESGDPLPPVDVDELVQRLWEGPVQVRDLEVIPFDVPGDESGAPADDLENDDPENDDAENDDPEGSDPENADPGDGGTGDAAVVRIDHRDTILVFAQISPALVSTPNPALSFRLEIDFSDEQLLAGGGNFETASDLARQLIGELLFFGSNVVSVDLTEISSGAQSVTDIAVADEWFIPEMNEFAPILFGESNVELATELIDGVDVVVALGSDYLRREVDRDEITDSNTGDTVDPDE